MMDVTAFGLTDVVSITLDNASYEVDYKAGDLPQGRVLIPNTASVSVIAWCISSGKFSSGSTETKFRLSLSFLRQATPISETRRGFFWRKRNFGYIAGSRFYARSPRPKKMSVASL